MKKMDKLKTGGNIARIIIAVMLTAVTLIITALSTYAWYSEEIEAAYQLDVDASGVLYLYVEAPIKPIVAGEEEERTLYPAKALAGAVANGLYLNPLEIYDPGSDNPSYVSVAAVPVTYKDKFILQQASGAGTEVNYSISVRSSHDSTGVVFDSGEFVFSDVSFSYWQDVATPVLDENGNPVLDDEGLPVTETTTVLKNPIASQTADKTAGVLYIEGAQSIDFSITMYLAYVDEIMDDALLGKSIWVEISLTAQIEIPQE